MEKEGEGQNAWDTPTALCEHEVPAQEVRSGEEGLGKGSGKMLMASLAYIFDTA